MWIHGRRCAAQTFALILAAAPLFDAFAQQDDDAERGWEIYQSARQAAGGERTVNDYTMEMITRAKTPQGQDVEIKSTVFFLAPDVVRQEIETPQAKVIVVFDGESGRQVLPNGVRYLPDKDLAQIRADIARTRILEGDPPAREDVRFRGTEEVEGKTADVIEIQHVADMPLRLFVDQGSLDVVKKMFVGDTPTGMAQVEEIFSDFRDVGGFRRPRRKRVLRNGEQVLESEVLEMKINVGLERDQLLR